MTNPADTIREAMDELKLRLNRLYAGANTMALHRKILAALTELEQQLADATRKYDAMDSRYHDLWHAETDRAEAAEADRDRLAEELANERRWIESADTKERRLIEQAQALRDALEQIADLDDKTYYDDPSAGFAAVARAALDRHTKAET